MRKKTPTRLDFAIMGLLMNGPLSGYQIRQIFESSDLGNYSSSPGSIYPALKRLQTLGLLSHEPQESKSGKAKRRFELTREGRSTFIAWLRREVSREEVYREMDELLLRFAFMDQVLTAHDQLAYLEQIAGFVADKIETLQSYLADHEDELTLTANLAIRHGIEVFRAHQKWTADALTIIQQTLTKNE